MLLVSMVAAALVVLVLLRKKRVIGNLVGGLHSRSDLEKGGGCILLFLR